MNPDSLGFAEIVKSARKIVTQGTVNTEVRTSAEKLLKALFDQPVSFEYEPSADDDLPYTP
jgi:hypothetical protein